MELYYETICNVDCNETIHEEVFRTDKSIYLFINLFIYLFIKRQAKKMLIREGLHHLIAENGTKPVSMMFCNIKCNYNRIKTNQIKSIF